jgi:hypothetical protein
VRLCVLYGGRGALVSNFYAGIAFSGACGSKGCERQVMNYKLRIVRNAAGSWVVQGFPKTPAQCFARLSAAVDYARRQSAAAPAMIEFQVGDFYAVVHQSRGWPNRLCLPFREAAQWPSPAGQGPKLSASAR